MDLYLHIPFKSKPPLPSPFKLWEEDLSKIEAPIHKMFGNSCIICSLESRYKLVLLETKLIPS